jgi:flagellar protein FlgJ
MHDIMTMTANSVPADSQAQRARLQDTAREFEASFLAEMLRAAKFGEPAGNFGGGIGEAQFASLLVDAQASEMAAQGGLGLAEMIVNSLMREQAPTDRGAT